MYGACSVRFVCTLLAAATLAVGSATSGQIVQHFPADQPAEKMETSWRIVWDVTRHAGRSEVLYIKEAYFKRSPKQPEVKILGDCRPAEMFVAYNNGRYIYDISGRFSLTRRLEARDLGPACVGSPRLFDDKGNEAKQGVVAMELHDDTIRWRSSRGASRRGQEMHLWSVLMAANYRYIIMYTFRDDGQVGFKLGATAHNLISTASDVAAHVHTACWRLNVELGNAEANDIQVVRYVSEPGSSKAKTVAEPFNEGKEGGIVWKSEEFTRVRVISRTLKNAHNPPRHISYELISTRAGNPRHYGSGAEFTHKDTWVTCAKTDEMQYRSVPRYADGAALRGPQVIWHQCSVLHTPRDEDFGLKGYSSRAGVALTSWSSFALRPRNFFAGTPLYDHTVTKTRPRPKPVPVLAGKVIVMKEDKLAKTDEFDKVRRKCFFKLHTLKMAAGRTYGIDLTGKFDTYLRLENAEGVELAKDDDSGQGLNSRLIFRPEKDGEYRIIVTSFRSNAIGEYTLTIREAK